MSVTDQPPAQAYADELRERAAALVAQAREVQRLRAAEARRRVAGGELREDVARSMGVSRQTLWLWLGGRPAGS